MGRAIQVAFQLASEDLDDIDKLVPGEFASRAAALRHAVSEWLDRRREDAIDAALAAGYQGHPDAEEEEAWAQASLEALESANLDW